MTVSLSPEKGLRNALQTLEGVVGSTMGPYGKYVIFPPDNITRDGVTAARYTRLDGLEGTALNVIRSASEHMDAEMGDGTTTATVLTSALVENLTVHPAIFRRDANAFLPEIHRQLDELGKKTTKQDLIRVGVVSATDDKLGKMVAETIWKIGKEGDVVLEYGDQETEVDLIPGYVLDTSYLTPVDVPRRKVELDEPTVLVYNSQLTSSYDAVKILENAPKKSIVVIAKDVTGDALGTFALNTQKGAANIICIKTTELADVALFTGAKAIKSTEDLLENSWGEIDKLICSTKETTLVGKKTPDVSHLEDEPERKAKLLAKTAKITVGGDSEPEKKDKFYRIEDAIGACKAAMDGIVPGGGTALAQIDLSDCPPTIRKTLRKALRAPYNRIMSNAAMKAKIRPGLVYDVTQKAYTDWTYIPDPLEVTKRCISTAISTAIAITSTGAVIYDKAK